MSANAFSSFAFCNTCQTQTIYYRGIRADDANASQPLANPERGLRLEHMMQASTLINPYNGLYHRNNMSVILETHEKTYNEKTKLTQLYFYLTDYLGKKIPDNALNNMQSIFDQLKKSGYKVILIFAYRYNDNIKYETYSDIQTHLIQLKKFLQKNEPMIFAFQAGFLGLWGEWHHSGLDKEELNKKLVIRDMMSAFPKTRKIQVRETIYKTNAAGYIRLSNSSPVIYYPLTPEEYNRIGFQNAYFVLDQGPYARWDYRYGDDDYKLVEKEAISSIVDGEMPYDGNDPLAFNMIALGNSGGLQAIKRMQTHAHSSFSVVHNYATNIAAWKNRFYSIREFRQQRITVSDDYFLNQQGQEVNRSAYDYIRDHLGYRFQATEAAMPSFVNWGDSANFSIQLKNFGFAPLINSRPVYFVLVDEQDNIKEVLTKADPTTWMPAHVSGNNNHTINQAIYFDSSFNPGKYRVGIWMPDSSPELKYDARYAIYLANGNIEWWQDAGNKYLINIIGSFQVN
ncbi:DUF4832 domain-containing protein [Terrimonas pollutisoli]|uniref:DUF4832 domain-containing protein n=1 Tax=Terrimonas pollutisoli TaxID=3034147 RepID=UPI0023EDA778|nr:DUF4832 domain-containing protein [Terrimonas sp. H1YJ31]